MNIPCPRRYPTAKISSILKELHESHSLASSIFEQGTNNIRVLVGTVTKLGLKKPTMDYSKDCHAIRICMRGHFHSDVE